MRALILFLLIPMAAQATSTRWTNRPYTSPAKAARALDQLGRELERAKDRRALFPQIYARTIQATNDRLYAAEFYRPQWVWSLVVNYANIYRRTIHMELTGRRAQLPKAWQMQFRYEQQPDWRADVDLVYGIHVHITRDLVEALYMTKTDYNDPLVRADFYHITEALAGSMPELWNVFQRYSQGLRLPACIEQSVMMSWIGDLRHAVWVHAASTAHLSAKRKQAELRGLDKWVVQQNLKHGVLLPIAPR